MDDALRKAIRRVFAESYSGSGDIDQHNVADGSETSDSETQNPLTNGGVYFDNAYQQAHMPYPLDAHDSQNDMADRDKPNPHMSNEYSDAPFGEQGVDDNHANVVASLDVDPEPVHPHINEVTSKLPPTPQGHTRLYRMEPIPTGKPQASWKQDNPEHQKLQESFGRWYTPHLNQMHWYATDQGVPSQMRYLDTPNQNFEATKVSNMPSSVQRYSKNPGGENFVTPEMKQSSNVVPGYDYNKVLPTMGKQADQDDSVAGGGANFLRHAPDSPEILNDGHADTELVEENGVNSVINNFVSKPTPQLDGMFVHDPSLTQQYKDKLQNRIPEINKGRTAMTRGLNPFVRSAREMPKLAEAWTDDTGSNVEDIEYAGEIPRKHDRSTSDFGNKDFGSDDSMSNAPNQTDESGESKLYSGIQPTGADATLQNYLKKIGYYNKKAVALMPSVNPNSGKDSDLSILPEPSAMTDGKMQEPIADKTDSDPYAARKHLKYKRTEDTQNYFNFGSTGGGTGNEGDGQNQSGVQPGS